MKIHRQFPGGQQTGPPTYHTNPPKHIDPWCPVVEDDMVTLPDCPKCKKQKLLPLSDYSESGGSILWKAWACPDVKCAFSIRIDNGRISYETIKPVAPR